MLVRVYERSLSLNQVDDIVVATDDDRIRSLCIKENMNVVMTDKNHLTAANRLHEVSEHINADFYIQINGDEPLIDLNALEAVIPDEVPEDIEFGTNIITEIVDPVQALDASNIKVVFDNNMNALYMSRTPIPYPYKSIEYKYYKHVGIIGYNKRMLDFYNKSAPGILEKIEGIDTLRFLDYGKHLKLIYVPNCHSLSVDTEKDLELVRKLMEKELYEKN
jgi:3-deoxy-manno-octulosonate cytidylyltransferase (CMP-KDO synthetase)